jgi:hypothetical protein
MVGSRSINSHVNKIIAEAREEYKNGFGNISKRRPANDLQGQSSAGLGSNEETFDPVTESKDTALQMGPYLKSLILQNIGVSLSTPRSITIAHSRVSHDEHFGALRYSRLHGLHIKRFPCLKYREDEFGT